MSLRDRTETPMMNKTMRSSASPLHSFLDDDLISVVETQTKLDAKWRDESPQERRMVLAPKRLREVDSTSQLSTAMDGLLQEQSYVETNIVLKSVNLTDFRSGKAAPMGGV